MANEATARVECYSGHRYAQRPVAIIWGEEHLEVFEVEAEWHTVEGKCFWVKTVDGRAFELSYSTERDEWGVETR